MRGDSAYNVTSLIVWKMSCITPPANVALPAYTVFACWKVFEYEKKGVDAKKN